VKKSAIGVWTAVLVLSVGGSVFALEGVEFGVSADFNGKYIWRGQVITDDPVFQPGVTMGIDKFTAGFWGNVNLTDYAEDTAGTYSGGSFTEYDYSLDYTTSVMEGVDLSVGAINYYFPSFEDTTELYWGFAFDLPLSPSVVVYHDIDEAKGTYVSFGIGHSIEKIAELSPDMPVGMEIGASLGWGSESYNEFYWGLSDSSALNDLAVSVAFPVTVGSWTVSPSVNYVTLLDSEIRNSDVFDTASEYFFAGVSLSTSF